MFKVGIISTIDGKYDEGMKNIASNIVNNLVKNNLFEIQRYNSKDIFLLHKIKNLIKCDTIIIFLRATDKVYSLCRFLYKKSNIILFVVQPIKQSFERKCNRKMCFNYAFVLNPDDLFSLKNKISYYQFILPTNCSKFKPVCFEDYLKNKEILKFNVNVPIVFHAGHLTYGRNLTDFLKIPSNFATKIIATSVNNNKSIKKELIKGNVIIFDKYLDNIELFFQIADVYLMPTISSEFVISVPMSVLEASATGLPILINKNFKNIALLESYIKNESIFKYDENNIIDVFKKALLFSKSNFNHSFLIKNNSWANICNQIIKLIGGINK